MFIYHKTNHEIVAISKEPTLDLHLDEPYKKTFYDSPPMDVDYGFLLFDGIKFMDNIPAYREAQKEQIKQSHIDYLSKGHITPISGVCMDADILDILKLKSGYELSMSLGLSIMEIRDFYNQSHHFEPSQVWEIIKALGTHYSYSLSYKAMLQNKINSLSIVSEIKEVTWDFTFDLQAILGA